MKKTIYLLTLFLILPFGLISQNVNNVLNNCLAAMSGVKTSKFSIVKKERFNGKLVTGESFVKIQDSPFKYYNKGISGVEVLYVEGKYGNNLYINPNGFPYTNLKLNPFSSRVMAKSHHPPHHARPSYQLSMLRELINLQNSNQATVSISNVLLGGIPVYKIDFTVKNYSYKNHTALQTEMLINLTDRLNINPKKTLELNSNLYLDSSIKKGSIVKVPSHIGSKVSLYINKATNYLLMQQTHDEVGLYEEYLYNDFVANPIFSGDEFTEDYKDYGF